MLRIIGYGFLGMLGVVLAALFLTVVGSILGAIGRAMESR